VQKSWALNATPPPWFGVAPVHSVVRVATLAPVGASEPASVVVLASSVLASSVLASAPPSGVVPEVAPLVEPEVLPVPAPELVPLVPADAPLVLPVPAPDALPVPAPEVLPVPLPDVPPEVEPVDAGLLLLLHAAAKRLTATLIPNLLRIFIFFQPSMAKEPGDY
jgi:hypothetical protein